ncbi:threonine-phosphate decarboxylase CobD [soil metagenome]
MSRFTWHGGGLEAAKAHYGDGPWLDLSTGINPVAWPGAAAIPVDWCRLPDEGALADLEGAAAAHFGVDPAHVLALPGTEVGLRLAGLLLPGRGRHVVPSYRTHGEMIAGSRPLSRDDLAQAAGGTLVFANPNNPDGHVFSRDCLHAILAARGDDWLVIDEAFADADPSPSMAGDVAEERRLLVFRSFGKFFGLAGVRLGFVIGPVGMLARIRAALGAWPVSAGAIAIGTAAYRDRDWIDETRDGLNRDALALDGLLDRAGLTPVGNCPLFRLVEVEDADALFERCAARAILTRPFAENPRWLRIGLPGRADDFARLERALADG